MLGCWFCSASWRATKPSLSLSERSAPAFRSAAHHGVVPGDRGRHQRCLAGLELARVEARLRDSISTPTISSWPSSAASIRGVRLPSSVAFTFAPESDQRLDERGVAAADRVEQQRARAPVEGVLVRAGGDQRLRQLRLAAARGEHQRREAGPVRQVELRAGLEQRVDDVGASRGRRDAERGVVVLVEDVRVDLLLDDRLLDPGQVAFAHRLEERDRLLVRLVGRLRGAPKARHGRGTSALDSHGAPPKVWRRD